MGEPGCNNFWCNSSNDGNSIEWNHTAECIGRSPGYIALAPCSPENSSCVLEIRSCKIMVLRLFARYTYELIILFYLGSSLQNNDKLVKRSSTIIVVPNVICSGLPGCRVDLNMHHLSRPPSRPRPKLSLCGLYSKEFLNWPQEQQADNPGEKSYSSKPSGAPLLMAER
jgi:hypothetical protein